MENKIILITGTSTGIGKATAKYFADKGWKVAATVRKKEDFFFPGDQPHARHFLLDVSEEEQSKKVVEDVIETFGGLDVLVNNAGVAVFGAFEENSPQSVEDQFEANLFGPMRLTRCVLPYFRKNRNGIIITVSTMGARTGVPFYSVHSATKFAVEGFFESIRFELSPFHIRVKLIEPGSYQTNISINGNKYNKIPVGDDYLPFHEKQAEMLRKYEHRGNPVEVAKAIWQAATDNTMKLRYVVGQDALQMERMKREMSDEQLFELMGRNFIE